MYEYKVVDGAIEAKKYQSFSEALEQLLNDMASEGWEFYCQANVYEAIPQGCLAMFSSPKIRQNQTFIFRREKKIKIIWEN